MNKIPYYNMAFLGMVGLLLIAVFQQKETIAYWQVPTIVSTDTDHSFIMQSYIYTLTGDIIYLRKAKDSTPLQYYKEVAGEVCFNEKCRLLDIVVYWNITGRYLGFELPEGEFLSKTDHEPFTDEEYQQLHSLLADESLPLDRTSFEDLLEPTLKMGEELDGYTGATSKSVAAMVVTGAAYTTYKLWNVVNGPTMDFVSELTEYQLTPALLNQILQSPDVADKIWALNRIDRVLALTPQLESSLFRMISSVDFYLSYSAINALNLDHLRSVGFQNRLFDLYQEANHSTKRNLLKKLMEAPLLSPEIVKGTRDLLPQLNGQQLKDFLQLYSKHNINDVATQIAVAHILKNKNKYVSKIAFTFLTEQEIDDDNIIKFLNDYENGKL